MKLCDISLQNFRNYAQEQLQFDPGVNLIVGKNAQGKTNLLEAIAYLGSGKSFRAQKTAQMLRFGTEFCQIEGNVLSQERQQNLRWVLFGDGRKRQLWKNGAKQKTAENISGVMSTVLFCPEDLMVLKTGASSRRRFCDMALCQLRPNYDAVLTEYHHILEQKSRILKDHFENPALLEILPEFNQRLCQVGALIISYRARFFQALGEAAKTYHQQFSGGAEEFSLQYRTVSTVKDPFAPTSELVENLQEHLQSHYRGELESANCLTGPHKDDFSVSLSEIDLKDYGSQGQTRTSAISLKLAQRDLMRREFGEEPILLLDDVLSELDPARQDFVLNHITAGQVFITCCEPEKLTRLGTTIEIENGKIQDQ